VWEEVGVFCMSLRFRVYALAEIQIIIFEPEKTHGIYVTQKCFTIIQRPVKDSVAGPITMVDPSTWKG
jgi:hypothetical protein